MVAVRGLGVLERPGVADDDVARLVNFAFARMVRLRGRGQARRQQARQDDVPAWFLPLLRDPPSRRCKVASRRRQVSWLAGQRQRSAFPRLGPQWRVGSRLAAHSCGGSAGLGALYCVRARRTGFPLGPCGTVAWSKLVSYAPNGVKAGRGVTRRRPWAYPIVCSFALISSRIAGSSIVAGHAHLGPVGDLLHRRAQGSCPERVLGQPGHDSDQLEAATGPTSSRTLATISPLDDGEVLVHVRLQDDEAERQLAFEAVRDAEHGALGDVGVGGEHLLQPPRREPVPGDVDDVVHPAHDEAVAVLVLVAGIAGEVVTGGAGRGSRSRSARPPPHSVVRQPGRQGQPDRDRADRAGRPLAPSSARTRDVVARHRQRRPNPA